MAGWIFRFCEERVGGVGGRVVFCCMQSAEVEKVLGVEGRGVGSEEEL